MPPRPMAPTVQNAPDWSALLLERAKKARTTTPQPPHRRRGPATLAEAIHRFVDRNWD